ncbi:MAG: hypothetical protein ACOZNI_24965 [Myxococcota bacterium]
METNPFRTQFHAFGERVLAANKQVADWQLGQVKLAEKQIVASLEATRAGWDAGVGASLAMQRTLLDAFFPSETKAA